MKSPFPFNSEEFTIHISEKAGSVSAVLFKPETCRAVVTLAHSAGAGMHQPFLVEICEAFAAFAIATIRFNFPYRESGKKMPDRFPVAAATIHAAIDEALTRVPDVPVFCAGKSFGGRMSSMAISEATRPEVKGLIFFGFPLHPPGKPSVVRAEHLEKVGRPMLFFQGTKDKLSYSELISAECAKLSDATLILLDGADHSLVKGKQSGVEYLVQRSAHWMDTVLEPGFGDSAGHLA